MVETGRRNLRRHADDAIEIRFENLIEDPQGELSRLGNFISHDLDYARIQASALGSVAKPNSSFRSQPQNGKFNPVNRWKSVCTPDELSALESVIAGLLGELGYQRASADRSDVRMWVERRLYRASFGTRAWLKRHSPLGKFLTNTTLLVNGFEGPKQHSRRAT